jgi:hypothetical protein
LDSGVALAAGSSLADTDIRASIRERSLSSMITLARLFALNQEMQWQSSSASSSHHNQDARRGWHGLCIHDDTKKI